MHCSHTHASRCAALTHVAVSMAHLVQLVRKLQDAVIKVGGDLRSPAAEHQPSRRALRVRVEIMGSHKCGTVGESQPVLTMINPNISTRTRIDAPCMPCLRHGDPIHAKNGRCPTHAPVRRHAGAAAVSAAGSPAAPRSAAAPSPWCWQPPVRAVSILTFVIGTAGVT